MPHSSTVKYNKHLSIFYLTLDSHKDHAPTRMTRAGKIWEKKLYDIYKGLLTVQDVAIDIGGYIGSHSLPMSMLCNQVYTFECNPELHNIINENIKRNNRTNITLFNIALGNNETDLTFYNRHDGTSRFSQREVKGEPIKLTTKALDDVLPDLEHCKLIKIDVEGHEYNVLEGAKELINRTRPYIFIETFKKNRAKLEDWALDNSYQFQHLGGDDFLLTALELSSPQ